MKLDQNIDFSIKIGPKFINFSKNKPFIHQNLDQNIFKKKENIWKAKKN